MNHRLHEDPERTTAVGMTRYSHEFLHAAILVYSSEEWWYETEHVPVPAYYLVGHATELALKAYLLSTGRPLKSLRAFGHDLVKCYAAAIEDGLAAHVVLTSEEVAALELLNVLYSSKQLNYIVTGAKRLAYFRFNSSAAVKLANAVAQLVGFPGRVRDYG